MLGGATVQSLDCQFGFAQISVRIWGY
jgi:hypothetical protein